MQSIPLLARKRKAKAQKTKSRLYAKFDPRPGVRERFVFSQHLYWSDFFWKVFADNFRLLWPFELRDCYRRNLRTGLYSISPAFSERIRDIQAWAMAPDFFVHFPDMYADIPVFQSVPASVPSYWRGERSSEGQTSRRLKVIDY